MTETGAPVLYKPDQRIEDEYKVQKANPKILQNSFRDSTVTGSQLVEYLHIISQEADDELKPTPSPLLPQQKRVVPGGIFKGNEKNVAEIDVKSPIYSLIVNCANFARLSYTLDTGEANKKTPDQSLIQNGAKVSLLGDRKPAGFLASVLNSSDDEKFNKSFDYFKTHSDLLSKEVEILNVFRIYDQGGTSIISKDSSKKWLILAFKGSKTIAEWQTDLDTLHTDYELTNPFVQKQDKLVNVKIHSGFLDAIKNLSKEFKIFEILKKHREENPGYKLIITGHSLGGALASVFGFEAQILGWNPLVVSLAAPRVAFSTGEVVSFPEQVTELFDVSPEKSLNAVGKGTNGDTTDALLDLKLSYFINVTNAHDVVPLVPVFPYEDLGGIELHLEADVNAFDNEFIPQRMTTNLEDQVFKKERNKDSNALTRKETKLNAKLKKNFPDDNFDEPKTIADFFAKVFQRAALDDNHRFYTLYALTFETNPLADFSLSSPLPQ